MFASLILYPAASTHLPTNYDGILVNVSKLGNFVDQATNVRRKNENRSKEESWILSCIFQVTNNRRSPNNKMPSTEVGGTGTHIFRAKVIAHFTNPTNTEFIISFAYHWTNSVTCRNMFPSYQKSGFIVRTLSFAQNIYFS